MDDYFSFKAEYEHNTLGLDSKVIKRAYNAIVAVKAQLLIMYIHVGACKTRLHLVCAML